MRKQRGVTMIGWIFLLVPVGITLYGGIRVIPEYLNYYKVIQALSESATALKSDDTLTVQSIRGAIVKRFDTGYVDKPSPDDIIIKKSDKGWEMTADYEATTPMFGNLYLLMSFKKTVVINN
jgi:hypothetical protein